MGDNYDEFWVYLKLKEIIFKESVSGWLCGDSFSV